MAIIQTGYLFDQNVPISCESWVALRNELQQGVDLGRTYKPLLWVGAGCSISNGYPTGDQLANKMLGLLTPEQQKHCKGEKSSYYQKIADYISREVGNGVLIRFLAANIDSVNKQPTSVHNVLVKIPWNQIITTNYDPLLENAWYNQYKGNNVEVLNNNLGIDRVNRTCIWKIHGSYDNWKSVILSQKSYETYRYRYGLLHNELVRHFQQHYIVFVGCSMRDERIQEILSSIKQQDNANSVSGTYIMSEEDFNAFNEEEVEYYKGFNIKPLVIASYDNLVGVFESLLDNITPKEFSIIKKKLMRK